ncbi:MAG: transglycosylase SLT domain-containing protein, partial [Sphingomonas oligoaromativorans]
MTGGLNLDALFQQASDQTGVPVALLKSLGVVESHLNPAQGSSHVAPAVGTEVGTGMMQLTPSTARDMGVDPRDPAQAVLGAARYLRQGYDATGNWDDAARYYHGGPDPSNWGPRTQAYHDKVVAAAQAATGDNANSGAGLPDNASGMAPASNPFLAMATGQGGEIAPPSSQPSSNPFLAMAQGDNGGGHGLLDNSDRADGAVRGGDAAVRGTVVPVGGPADGQAARSGGFLSTVASFDPWANALVNGGSLGAGLGQAAGGTLDGALRLPETAASLTADGLDALGILPGSAEALRRAKTTMERVGSAAVGDPTTNIAKGHELAGAILASLPAGELAPFGEVAPGAKGLAAVLRRYGNLSAQGALGGVAVSKGENVARDALAGGVFAAGGGALINNGLPIVARGMEAIQGSKLAQALRKAIGMEAGDAAASGPAVTMDPQTLAALRKIYPEYADLTDQQFAAAWARGRNVPTETDAAGNPLAQQFVDEAGRPSGGIDRNGRLVVDVYGSAAPPQTIRRGSDLATDGVTGVDPSLQNPQGGGAATGADHAQVAPPAASPADLAASLRNDMSARDVEQAYSQQASDAVQQGAATAQPITPSRPAASIDDARGAAAGFIGQPIANQATGIEATVSRSTLAKMTNDKAVGKSSSTTDHALAVAHADELFRTAEPISRYPDPRGEPTLHISRWRSYMQTPDGLRGVKMTVKETAHPSSPNPLYTIETMEVEPGPAAQGGNPIEAGIPNRGSEVGVAQPVAGANQALVDALRQQSGATPSPAATEAARAGDTRALADALRTHIGETGQVPQIAANDLGSRGARIGLEANTDFPPQVQQHAQALIADGLPAEQALREAEITYVGAQPTLASVTRNPSDQRALWEGAKQDTPEGQALATQIANNNAALHSKAQDLVQRYGGAPAEGDVAEGAAKALATDEDTLRRAVGNRYAEAEAAEGTAKVPSDDLYAYLTNPYHAGAINRQAQGLVAGLRKRLDLFTGNTGALNKTLRPLNAHALEHLRKTAIDAYDEVGSPELRNIIGGWTDLIDEHLVKLGEVGPTYARARKAFEEYARLYKDPEGLSALIRRNDRGAFVNADKWRLAEQKFLGGSNDRTALQVIQRLRDLPENAGKPVLDRLKARVIQQAYEAATGRRAGNAVDLLGNSSFSGKLFLDRLNQVGMTKLNALFSKEELGELATVGRAGSHVNEAVPGTVNTSGTASTLLNAIRDMGSAEKQGGTHKVLRLLGHTVGGITHPGLANVAVEGISHAASAARKSA